MNIGPRSHADMLAGTIDPDIYIDPWGRAMLAPDNLAVNPFFVEVGRNGNPLYYNLQRGREQIGNHAYLSKPGRPQTQTRQNISTLPMTFDGWPQFSPIVNGARKPVVNDALPAARLVAVDKAYTGFRGGEREAAYTWSTVRGSETGVSQRSTFITSQGNCIKWTFEDEPPPNSRWRNLYLTDPGSGALRFQERIPAKKREHTMFGPYRYNGRPAPTRNSTYVGRAEELRWRGPFPNLRIAPGGLTMQDGIYRWRIVEVTKNGTGFPGPPSEERVVELGWIWNHQRDAEGRLTGVKIPLAPARKHAVYLMGRPRDVHPDTIGINIIVEKNRVNYLMDRSHAMGPHVGMFPLAEWISIYGYQLDSFEQAPPAPRYARTMTEYTRPEEDTSGIPSPTDAPPVPDAQGYDTPSAGWYFGSYAPVFEDEEYGSAPYSGPQGSVYCSASEIPEVQFPNLSNVLRNAEFGKVGANGKPLNWIWHSAAGEIINIVNGVCQVTTGLQQNTSNLPRIVSFPEFMDTNDIWTFRGRIRLRAVESGSVRVMIKEWTDETRTTEVASYSVTTLVTKGEVEWTLTYGPAGSGADRTWNEGAGTVGYVIQAEGNPHSLTFELEDFSIHPFEGGAGLRKYGLPEDHTQEDPNPQATEPFYPSNIAVVAEPPIVSTVKADTPAPIQRAYFENVIPGHYSLVQATGSASHTFTTQNPITGDYILRVSDTNTSATTGGSRIWRRQYGTNNLNGRNMAIRLRGRFLKRPTKATAYGPTFLEMKSATANAPTLMRVTLHPSGWLLLIVHYAGGKIVKHGISGGIVSGDEYDIEIIALGSGSSQGSATVKFAKNGGERRTVLTTGGINWTGHSARICNFGVWSEETPSNTWQFEFDELVVTPTGDMSEPVGVRSPGISFPKPDRPYKAGKVLAQGASILTHVEPTPAEVLGIKGEWTISAPARVLGTGSAAIRYTAVNASDTGQARIAHVIPAVANSALSVAVSGSDVTVSLATNAAGAASSTASQVVSAVNAHAGASAILTAAAEGDGTGVVGAQTVLPLAYDVQLLTIGNNAGLTLASVRIAANRDMYLRTHDAVLGTQDRVLAFGVSLNETHGAEIVASGAGSTGGRVDAFYYPPTGSQELRGIPDGLDWEDRMAVRAFSSRAGGRSSVGTVVSRLGSLIPRQSDPLDRPIKQFYMFKHPLIPQEDLGLRGTVCAVVPGQTYTVAWLCYCKFAGREPGQFPLFYYLQGTDGSRIPLGSVFGRTANTIDGSSVVGSGATGSHDWADRWFAFTVPTPDPLDPDAPIYNELVVERGTVTQGIFVFQEQLAGKGLLSTPAQRDDKRTYNRAAGPASIVVPIPFGLPNRSPLASLGQNWGGLFGGGDAPNGTAIDLRYSSSPTNPPVSWRPWSADPNTVQPEAVLGISATLSRDDAALAGADGERWATPVVAPRNIGYRMYHNQSTLLDEDGMPLAGGNFVNGVEDSIELPNYHSEEVAGAALTTATTPRRRVLPRQLEIHFFSAEGLTKFLNESADHDWTIEAPHLGSAGRRFRIRCYAPAQPQGQRLVTAMRDENLRRHVWGSAVVAKVQVIEEGDLR